MAVLAIRKRLSVMVKRREALRSDGGASVVVAGGGALRARIRKASARPRSSFRSGCTGELGEAEYDVEGGGVADFADEEF